mgnify:CR=1 FL=1
MLNKQLFYIVQIAKRRVKAPAFLFFLFYSLAINYAASTKARNSLAESAGESAP